MAAFTHLHVHTHYSLLKSSCSVHGLVDQCVKHKQTALAITDYGNMFGALDMYFQARKHHIKPLLGLDIYLCTGDLKDKNTKKTSGEGRGSTPPNLVLLAQNLQGYRNLCQINTIAYREGFYYVPRVDFKTLHRFQEGVLALTGGFYGDVMQQYLKSGPQAARASLQKLKNIYRDRLYMELNRTGVARWDQQAIPFLMELAEEEKVPLIATNNIHHLKKKDQVVQDVLQCIGTNHTLQDRERTKLPSQEFYFKSSEEMRKTFHDIPTACDNTLECTSRLNVEFVFEKNGKPIYHLPRLKGGSQGSKNSAQTLKNMSAAGLQNRWQELKQQNKTLTREEQQTYQTRLDKELKIITSRGFTDYFLIIQDFVHWAKKEGIPVGPGRGSGASSLVAWSLGITDLDPMPYRLLFERFLNPERISLPDFDVDFCQEHRNRVIEYVTKKYGSDYVAQVMTYGRLQARAATRDVGRVLGMSYQEVDQVARLIPEKPGTTLKQAIEGSSHLRELMETNPQVESLIALARQIEGLIRHVSIHAAGVIIANRPILDYAPLYPGAQNENVIQCDLHHSKKMGLVKFDFLGLKTLTQIHKAFEFINQKTKKRLRPRDISLQDGGIYKLMGEGDTKGVFQFEGEGITQLLRRAKPSCFEDIVAINALYRPGPMEMIPSYLDRKKGTVKVEYLFSELEPILKETYGVIVYQEQVLLIAAEIAGYSYGEADVLRRAMGEKKPAVMKKQKSRFLQGAGKNGHNLKKAEKLFDLVAEFAKYGFNKSHAAAYCVLAAQTAWLKKYYPTEFFASLLTVEMNNTDKMFHYVKNARARGIKVTPPHINHSEYMFVPNGDSIRFSLGAIKGVGKPAVEEILRAKNHLPGKKFVSVFEFFETVDIKKITKKTVEALARAGAFGGLKMSPPDIISNYEVLLKQAEQKKQEKCSGQINLFSQGMGGAGGKVPSPPSSENQVQFYKPSKPWSEAQLLEEEKSVLGFYLTSHPMEALKSLRACAKARPLSSLTKEGGGVHRARACVWGLLDSLREVRTKKNNTMAFARLEDETHSLEVVFFSDIYLKFKNQLQSRQPLCLNATVDRDKKSDSLKLIAQDIETVQNWLGRCQKLVLHLTEKERGKLKDLKTLLTRHTGEVPLYFSVKREGQAPVSLKWNQFRGVKVSMGFLKEIKNIIGDGQNIHLG